MQARHKISKAAIELIKAFEGFQQKAVRAPEGRWAIGYGHTLTVREGVEVSRADAEALLLYDLVGVSHAVNEWVFTPLEQNQFDALCAFAFGVGLETFRRSEVLKRVNEGDILGAAAEIELWRRAEVDGVTMVVDALVRRRAAEKALFLTPQAGWTPAPSALLRPLRDDDGGALLLQDAVAIEPADEPEPADERPSLHEVVEAFPQREMDALADRPARDLSWVSRIAKVEVDSVRRAEDVEPGQLRLGVISLSMVGLLGVALLAVSLYRTPAAGLGPGPLMSWVIGITGLTLLCTAAYQLLLWLSRVGEKEEQ